MNPLHEGWVERGGFPVSKSPYPAAGQRVLIVSLCIFRDYQKEKKN